jgi:Ca2+-binding EF-hand superfamily protein
VGFAAGRFQFRGVNIFKGTFALLRRLKRYRGENKKFNRRLFMKFRIFVLTVFSLLIASVAAVAQETVVSSSSDGTTTKTTTVTRYYYDTQDVNQNGIIDSREFAPYVYSRWDLNRDGYVSTAEWNHVSRVWYNKPTQVEYSRYSYWDKNNDGRITADEVESNITQTKVYSTWDVNANDLIESDEYAAGTFRLYDVNGDGLISMEEWKLSSN